jgi:hypothetical protein
MPPTALEWNMTLTNEIFGEPEPLFAGYPRFVRVKTALPLVGIGKSKLYELLRSGRITAIRLDGATLIDLHSVARLFSQCPAVVPQVHQRVVTEAVLGFPEHDPMPDFTITAADLAAMGHSDSGKAADAAEPVPAPHASAITADAPVAAARAANGG